MRVDHHQKLENLRNQLLMMFSHRLPGDFWPVGLMRSKKVNFLYLANDSNLRAPSTSLLGVTKF